MALPFGDAIFLIFNKIFNNSLKTYQIDSVTIFVEELISESRGFRGTG